MTRDALMTQLYFSGELKKAARHLSQSEVMAEDLLSEAILKIFSKYSDEELLEKHHANTLRGLVFVTMRNAQTDIHRLNNVENIISIDERDSRGLSPSIASAGEQWILFSETLKAIEPDESIEISKQEKEDSEALFGGVSSLGVKLMRHIDKADSEKKKTRNFGKRLNLQNYTWSIALIERFNSKLELVSSKFEVLLNFCPQR